MSSSQRANPWLNARCAVYCTKCWHTKTNERERLSLCVHLHVMMSYLWGVIIEYYDWISCFLARNNHLALRSLLTHSQFTKNCWRLGVRSEVQSIHWLIWSSSSSLCVFLHCAMRSFAAELPIIPSCCCYTYRNHLSFFHTLSFAAAKHFHLEQ